MCGRLGRGVALLPQLLLNLGKLVVCIVGGHAGKIGLALDGRVTRNALQWLLNHAHVDILLMSGSNVLLLLLKKFDLLLESELFHHQGSELRRAASMGNVKSAARPARDASRSLLSHLDGGQVCRLLAGEQIPFDFAGSLGRVEEKEGIDWLINVQRLSKEGPNAQD